MIVKKVVIVLLLISSIAFAENIQIDFSVATDAELKEAILMLQAEQVTRYKNNLANQKIAAKTLLISFGKTLMVIKSDFKLTGRLHI